MCSIISNEVEKLKVNYGIKNIFLFVTATKTETEAFKKIMKPLNGVSSILKLSLRKNTYSIGIIGLYNVVHVMCGDMGAAGRDSSILTVTEAIDDWKPCGVVMVGIAFGMDKQKQKIGDVLVSKSVINYECVRLSSDKTEFRSKNVESGQILYNRFYNKDNWQHNINGKFATPLFGSILSGEKLIDNISYKTSLFEQFPYAIGGEMEGFGVYSASANRNITEWIIVKGICDWADGLKNKNKQKNQRIATESAVSLCEAVFSEDVFSELYNSKLQISTKKKDYRMPLRNKLFSGRDTILDIISEKFVYNNVVVLSGLSGIGKSQIAKEYVYRYQKQEEFGSAIWITAIDYTQLIQEYSSFIEYFNLSMQSMRPDNDDIVDCFKSYFESENSILVIDNANNIALHELINYLPQKNVKIIITTQNSNWDGSIVDGIVIDNFLEREASDYLLKYTNNRLISESDVEDSNKLLQTLNCYPLAIEYARAYINKRKISFNKYLEIFNEYTIKLFSGGINDYHQNAMTAWRISLINANDISNSAKEFLYCCSLLSFVSIPTDVLFVENEIYTRLELDNIINALLSYSLIEIINDCTISIHPLMQEYIKLEQKEEGRYDEFVNQQIKLIWSSFPENITTKAQAQKTKVLIPHGFSIMNALFQDEYYIEIVMNIANNLSGKLYNFGDYINTINCINTIINVLEKDTYFLEYVKFLNNLSLSYHYIGKTEKAILCINEALSDIEKITDNSILCTLYNTKGIIAKEAGEYPEALSWYKLALKLAKNLSDKNIFVTTLMNIGIIHKHNQEYPKAINAYKFCLNICESIRIKFKLLSNLAIIYKETGNVKLAIPIFEDCLEYEKDIGDLRSYAISHDHLGYCYLVEGNKPKSHYHLEEALNIADEINFEYGKANTYFNYGTYYLQCGDLKLAKNNYKKCFDISIKLNYKKGIFLASTSLSKLPSE